MKKLIFYFYPLLLLIVFLAHYLVVGQAVYGDGIYYYSYVRSGVKDKNLDFRNEFNHHYNRANNNALKEDTGDNYLQKTKTGLFPNKYNIGAPLSWAPSFLLADVISSFLNIFHKTPILGYSDIYQVSVGLSNVLFVAVGVIVIFIFLQRKFDSKISFLATSTLLFATNLFYYGALDVINSHPISFLVSSTFMVCFFKTRDQKSYKRYIILGILIGFLGLIRTQDLIFISIVFFEDALLLFEKETKWNEILLKNFLMLSFIFIAFSPQFFAWKAIFGSYSADPYISSGEHFDFTRPHILELLTNSKNGVLFTSPVLLIAAYFLFKKTFLDKNYKKNKDWPIYLTSLSIILLEFYLIACWSGWTQGESYGIRMLISVFPFFAFGLASFYQLLLKKPGKLISYAILLLFSFLNLGSIFYFLLIGQSPTFIGDKNSQQLILERLKNYLR